MLSHYAVLCLKLNPEVDRWPSVGYYGLLSSKIVVNRARVMKVNPLTPNWGFSHDVTKIQTTKVSMLQRFTFMMYKSTSGHAVGELSCGSQPRSQAREKVLGMKLSGSQPTAPVCVVWCWRLKGCFAPASAGKRIMHKVIRPIFSPTALPCWWGLTRPKRLSMSATAWVIWLCAYVRHWSACGLMFECVTYFYCWKLILVQMLAPNGLLVLCYR